MINKLMRMVTTNSNGEPLTEGIVMGPTMKVVETHQHGKLQVREDQGDGYYTPWEDVEVVNG